MPLTVTLADGLGHPLRVPGLSSWLRRVAPRRARGEVTIALVTDARMRQLNRQFRGKDYSTDVLSFPAVVQPLGPAGAGGPKGPHDGPPHRTADRLGDIVIAQGVARRQARELGHSLTVELKVLALHGLLHLLGYDHERDDGQMRRVEQRLRRKGGLREGLIERA